jgi:hypothetical protein
VSGGQTIAISWLAFAAIIAIWGGLFAHIAIPIIAVLVLVIGTFLILRRKRS